MATTTTKPCSAATGLIYLDAKPRPAPCIASSNPFVHSLSLPITRQIRYFPTAPHHNMTYATHT
jgi:hypothetical protein